MKIFNFVFKLKHTVMNRGEFESYVEKNYKISLDKIFEETEPDGDLIIREVSLFFDKLNSLYEVKEELNFEFFIRFLTKIDNLCGFDFHDEFIRNQWLGIITEFLPNHKIKALREISYFVFQDAKYWERLDVLKFSLIHLDKSEKIIKSHISNINSLIIKEWSERDENWKNFTESFLSILQTYFDIDKLKEVEIVEIQKALKEFGA